MRLKYLKMFNKVFFTKSSMLLEYRLVQREKAMPTDLPFLILFSFPARQQVVLVLPTARNSVRNSIFQSLAPSPPHLE